MDYQANLNRGATFFGYNGRGMISSMTHKNGSGQSLASREYWRDERDRIVAWKRGPSGGPNGMEDGRGDRYEYDEEGQLKKASYRAAMPESSPTGALRSDEFQYDELGNRAGTNRVASRGVMNFERKNNGLNQYRGWWPYSIANYDEDLEGWGEPEEANGVMMQDGWITASFNALNQPMGMWSPVYNGTGNYMWFAYDPLGRCVKRWVGPLVGTPPHQHAPPASTNPATYYYYDGWNLVQEGSSGNAVDRVYVHGGRVDEIVASWAGGQWAFHHYDARGHCILLTNALGGGIIREQYDYDAFGLPYFYNASGARLGASGQWGNRFLFTGREWLQDLRIYDFRHRQYQPELGRFLQPDPKQFTAGDYNLYRYCHNDPVNKSDPTGELGVYLDVEAELVPIFGYEAAVGIFVDFSDLGNSGIFESNGFAGGGNVGIGIGGGFVLRELDGKSLHGDINLGKVSVSADIDEEGFNGMGTSLGPGIGADASLQTARSFALRDAEAGAKRLFGVEKPSKPNKIHTDDTE